MEILKGLLFINGKDVYTEYGAYLSEDAEGEYENYSSLLKIGKAKTRTAVDFPEEHGRKYGQKVQTLLDERSVSLQFCIEGESRSDFLLRYSRFVSMLCSGDDDGWLNFNLPELGKTYRLLYSDCQEWSQLTPLDGKVYASFTVIFTEPAPDYDYSDK